MKYVTIKQTVVFAAQTKTIDEYNQCAQCIRFQNLIYSAYRSVANE